MDCCKISIDTCDSLKHSVCYAKKRESQTPLGSRITNTQAPGNEMDHLTGLLSGCFTITVNTLPRLGKILLQICLLGFVSMEKKRLFEDTTAHTHPHTQ